ncbi:MAG: protein jag [Clostridiales bacterium]|nr:protein jag [Clostridiales bacterium]
MRTIESIGKTVDEAIDNGLRELGLSPEEVVIDVLDEGGKGVFGLFGVKMARVRVTEKEAEDTAAGRAVRFLVQVARLAGVSDPGIAVAEDDHGIKIRMEGDRVGTLIGHRGATLDALQLLTGLVVNHQNGESEDEYRRVTLDIGSYRREREEALERLAEQMAQKTRRTGRSVSLEPMNSYERRIIHAALANEKGITTFSKGEEPNRHVVISLE